VGNGYLIKDAASIAKGVEVLIGVSDDPGCLFNPLLENPTLCDIEREASIDVCIDWRCKTWRVGCVLRESQENTDLAVNSLNSRLRSILIDPTALAFFAGLNKSSLGSDALARFESM
jgi:hypothetical protein